MIVGRHLETMAMNTYTNGHTNGHSNGDGKKVLKIAGVSGGVFDRFRAMEDLSKDPSIDGKSAQPHQKESV